jgi:hypothetical protein
MMVNGEVGAIFLGHTKAGARAAYRELENFNFRLVGKRHWNPWDLRQMSEAWNGPTPIRNLDWWEEIGGWERDWKFFCTLRDPFAFLLSHYCWHPYSGKQEVKEPIDVAWLRSLRSRFPQYFPWPGKLWRFLYNPGDIWRIMRLETLEDDLLGVLAELGLPGALQVIPQGALPEDKTMNKPEGDPREWFTPSALRWFRTAYAEELEMTGYDD